MRNMKTNFKQIKETPDDIISDYIAIFKRALDRANREKIDPMTLLEMDEEEKQKMREIQECLLSIEETVRRLEE